MEMLEHMKRALDYIEENLAGEIDHAQIAKLALCSPYHFQRMFVFLTGVPLSEYIRRRRLTLAAIDLQNTNDRVIDVAIKYGYSSADSFARAFQAIHSLTPSKAREQGAMLKVYPRVSFTLSLKGVQEMNFRLEKKPPFQILGVRERFSYADNLGACVQKMWAEFPPEKYIQLTDLADDYPGGLVGAYSEMHPDNTTDYYIGTISHAVCPNGLLQLSVPETDWAIFEISGALTDPETNPMKDIWGRIFTEWFPTTGYEHAEVPEVEWYSAGDMTAAKYKSEIWIPVVKKMR